MRRSTVLTSITVAGTLAFAGCGQREPSNEEQVRAVMAKFATATAEKDYAVLCGELLDPVLLDDIRQIGLPCEVALQQGLGDVENPRLTVGKVVVAGLKATAETRTSAAGQEPSRDLVALSKATGEWRISDLAAEPGGSGTASPQATPPGAPGSPGEGPASTRTPTATPVRTATVPAPPTPVPTP